MSNRRIIGVDWNAVGRGALGVGHVTGKLLLNAFAGGAGVSQIDELQEKGGQLPDWAAKAPTLVANKPTKVIVLDKNDKPRTFENVTKVTVRGGKRSEVDGGAIVEGPNKVEIEQPSGTQRPEAKAILVTGGVQAQEQPQQGLGSIVRVTGDLMDDMDDIDVNLEVVSEPSDEGTIDVFGEISSDRSMPLEMRLAQHRLSSAQARLAATAAKQPRTPAALPPMNIQNYDFQNLAPSGMTMDDFSNLDAEFTDVLGHSDDAGWTEIHGETDSDYFVGCDALGADADRPMMVRDEHVANAQVVADPELEGDFEILGALPPGATLAASPAPSTSRFSAISRPTVPQRKGVPARAASTKAGTPAKGKRFPQRATKRAQIVKRPLAFASSIKNAGDAVKRAKARSAKLTAKLKQIKAKANGQPTSVRGDVDILGALSTMKRPSMDRTPTTDRQKAAARNLERSRKKLANAIMKAQKKGADLPAKADALAKKVTSTTALVKQVLTKKATFPAPGKKTTVRGDVDILGDVNWTEVLGEGEVGDWGVPDPRFGDEGAAPSTDSATEGPLYNSPNLNSECIFSPEVPLPARGQPLPAPGEANDAFTAFDAVTMPPEAIPYDLSRGLPRDSVGSAILFYGAEGSGAYKDGGVTDGFKWGRGRNALEASDMMEDGWVHRDLKGSVQASGPQGHWAAGLTNEDLDKRKGLATAPGSWGRDMLRFWNTYQVYSMHGIAQTVPQVHQHSISVGWGPLVGNPNGMLAGLRYSPDGGPTGEGVWFWLPENAPSWATSKVDGDIKKLNAEKRAVEQADCDLQKAQDAIDAAERDRNRAANEYDLSMATNQQEVESAINADKLAQAQAAADAQLAQQQAQMEMQADQAYLQWQIQQAKLEQQTEAAALQYAMQNPEEVQQSAAQGADEFVNEGFFEGTTTDRAEEEEIMEQVDRVPEELDFIPQEGAISDVDLGPEEF